MNIKELGSQELRKALALVERREVHQTKIAEIEQALEALLSPQVPKPVQLGKAFTPAKARKAGKRAQVKEVVIELIKQAGRQGITLKAILAQSGVSQSSLNSWMHATGKKIRQIKKIGRGQYAWVG